MSSVKLRPGSRLEATPWPPVSLHSSKQVTQLSLNCIESRIIIFLFADTCQWPGSGVYPGYYDQAQAHTWQPWGGLHSGQGQPQSTWTASGLSPNTAAMFSYPAPSPLVVSVDTAKISPPAQVGHEQILRLFSCAWFSGGSLSSQSHHRVRIRLQQLRWQPDRQRGVLSHQPG